MGETKLIDAAFSWIAPVAICRHTPSEVEVSPRVKERGGKAKNEDFEEPADISIQSGEMIIFIKEY